MGPDVNGFESLNRAAGLAAAEAFALARSFRAAWREVERLPRAERRVRPAWTAAHRRATRRRRMQRQQREYGRIMAEAEAEEAAYIARGVCDRCGANSEAEAERLCRPTQEYTGDYSCPGDVLWEAERG